MRNFILASRIFLGNQSGIPEVRLLRGSSPQSDQLLVIVFCTVDRPLVTTGNQRFDLRAGPKSYTLTYTSFFLPSLFSLALLLFYTYLCFMKIMTLFE